MLRAIARKRCDGERRRILASFLSLHKNSPISRPLSPVAIGSQNREAITSVRRYGDVRAGSLWHDRAAPRRAQRKTSSLCRLCAVIGIALLLGISYLVVLGARGVYRDVNQPMSYLTDLRKNKNITSASARVLPLIDGSTPFALRATVWLDVTAHLEAGHALPRQLPDGRPLQVIHYSPSSNTTARAVEQTAEATQQEPSTAQLRTEVILYEETILEGFKMLSKGGFAELPLYVPAHPLYSQLLGPSSLRATFTVVPSDQATDGLGTIYNATSIFNGSEHLRLPRSRHDPRITPDADTLEAALSGVGVSVPLLDLLPSGHKYTPESPMDDAPGQEEVDLQCSGDNVFVRRDYLVDNIRPSLQFVKQSHRDDQKRIMYLGKDCQIWVPHILSRVRLVLAKERRHFSANEYMMGQNGTARILQKHCWSNKAEGDSDGGCALISSVKPLELLLRFKDGDSADPADSVKSAAAIDSADSAPHLRYGPQLSATSSPNVAIDRLTVPRVRPTSDMAPAPSDICKLPQLPLLDEDFFFANISVRFSAHGGIRRGLPEHISIHAQQATQAMEPLPSPEFQIRFNRSLDLHAVQNGVSFLTGDRLHPRSRPWAEIAELLVVTFILFGCEVLTLWYWSTRTTTAGLSQKAQGMLVAALGVRLTAKVFDIVRGADDVVITVLQLSILFPVTIFSIYYRVAVLGGWQWSGQGWQMRRRVPWKLEKKSARAEQNSVLHGTRWFSVALLGIALVYHVAIDPKQRALTKGVQCDDDYDRLSTPTRGDAWSKRLVHFDESLLLAGNILQLLFNSVSTVGHTMTRKNSSTTTNNGPSFAGTFSFTAYFELLGMLFLICVTQFESVGGWRPKRDPFRMNALENLIMSAITAWQAWRFPAVKQPRPKNGGEWTAVPTAEESDEDEKIMRTM